jgi:hypothetical protein
MLGRESCLVNCQEVGEPNPKLHPACAHKNRTGNATYDAARGVNTKACTWKPEG